MLVEQLQGQLESRERAHQTELEQLRAKLQHLQQELDVCKGKNQDNLSHLQQRESTMERQSLDLEFLLQQCQTLKEEVWLLGGSPPLSRQPRAEPSFRQGPAAPRMSHQPPLGLGHTPGMEQDSREGESLKSGTIRAPLSWIQGQGRGLMCARAGSGYQQPWPV